MSFRSRLRKLESALDVQRDATFPHITEVVVENRQEANWMRTYATNLKGHIPADLPTGPGAFVTFAEFATALLKAKTLPAELIATLPLL